jgi:large subunit ribosomal protein L25
LQYIVNRIEERGEKMENLKLKASQRKVFGKNTVGLRKQGITPIHVFGNGIESLSLQCDSNELKKIISHEGATRLINIEIEKEKLPRSVFIREIQRNALNGQLLHVDFYQVNKAEKMTAEIPIIFVGEAPAVKSKDNMIEHQLTHIEIEALPDKMPPHIQIDISNLKEAGDTIHIKDIKLIKDISTTADPDQVVVKVLKIKAAAEPEAAAPGAEEAKTVEETEAENKTGE